MMKFYKIAGLTVAMESYGRTVTQSRPYLIEPCSTIDIKIEPDIPEVKQRFPNLSDESQEYLATGASFYRQLLRFDGLLLHASAVVFDGRAYLFTASSGTGKSTHTSLWLKQFGDSAFILNDDKPALRLEDGIWYAYGTPWSGKHDISVNARVPLAGIACVERAMVNKIELFQGRDALLSILRQTGRPKQLDYRVKILELLDKLITMVPIWKLRCNMDPEAAIVSYEAMSGKKWRN